MFISAKNIFAQKHKIVKKKKKKKKKKIKHVMFDYCYIKS
jgi:hypothetical protein